MYWNQSIVSIHVRDVPAFGYRVHLSHHVDTRGMNCCEFTTHDYGQTMISMHRRSLSSSQNEFIRSVWTADGMHHQYL